ncbi:MAG: DUF2852 domain-containing protein [Paracoccaceae bacterium]
MASLRGVEQWLDDRGRKAWIFAMILGFIFVWPVGLGLLAYMIWSKRMFSRSCGNRHEHSHGPWGHQRAHMAEHFSQMRGAFRPSGNAAFDAYKADTIRRLQEEQEAFEAFLQRLREAKDKSEFDNFMEDRAKANSASANTPATPDAGPARTGEY